MTKGNQGKMRTEREYAGGEVVIKCLTLEAACSTLSIISGDIHNTVE